MATGARLHDGCTQKITKMLHLNKEQMAELIRKRMETDGVRGRGGKVLSAPTIARQALQNL